MNTSPKDSRVAGMRGWFPLEWRFTFPPKQKCIDVDINNKCGAALQSQKVRGRFAEGFFPAEARGMEPFDLHIVV